MERRNSQIWKTIILQLTPAILGSSLIATSVGGFFYESVVKPNIEISIVPNGMDGHNASLLLSNHGQVPATNLKLLLTTPEDILGYNTFSVENMTLKKINPRLLEIIMPRLIGGEGSITRISLLMDNKTTGLYNNYSAYAVYDQGSSRGLVRPANGMEGSNFIGLNNIFLILGVTGSIIILWLFFYLRYIKNYEGKKSARRVREEYDKALGGYIKSNREIVHLVDCLIGLQLLLGKIENDYDKGYINRILYSELSKAINEGIEFVIYSSHIPISDIQKYIDEKIKNSLNVSQFRMYNELNKFIKNKS